MEQMTPEEQEDYIQQKTQIINEYKKKQGQLKNEQYILTDEMKNESDKQRKLSDITHSENRSKIELQKSIQKSPQNEPLNQNQSQNQQKDKNNLNVQGSNRNNKYGQNILGQIDASESQYITQNDQSLSPKNQNQKKNNKKEIINTQENKLSEDLTHTIENKIQLNNQNVDDNHPDNRQNNRISISEQYDNELDNKVLNKNEQNTNLVSQPSPQIPEKEQIKQNHQLRKPSQDNSIQQNQPQNKNLMDKSSISLEQQTNSLLNQDNSQVPQDNISENLLITADFNNNQQEYAPPIKNNQFKTEQDGSHKNKHQSQKSSQNNFNSLNNDTDLQQDIAQKQIQQQNTKNSKQIAENQEKQQQSQQIQKQNQQQQESQEEQHYKDQQYSQQPKPQEQTLQLSKKQQKQQIQQQYEQNQQQQQKFEQQQSSPLKQKQNLVNNTNQNNQINSNKEQDILNLQNQNLNQVEQNQTSKQQNEEFLNNVQIQSNLIDQNLLEFKKQVLNKIQYKNESSPEIDPKKISLSKNQNIKEREEQHYGSDIMKDYIQSEKDLNAIYEDTKENISTIQNNSGSNIGIMQQQSSHLRIQGNQQNNSKLSKFNNQQKNMISQSTIQQQIESNDLINQPFQKQQENSSINQQINQADQQPIQHDQQQILMNETSNQNKQQIHQNDELITQLNKQEDQINLLRSQINQPISELSQSITLLNQSINQLNQQANLLNTSLKLKNQNNMIPTNSDVKSVDNNINKNQNPQSQNSGNSKQGLNIDSLNQNNNQNFIQQNQQKIQQQQNQKETVKQQQEYVQNLPIKQQQQSQYSENDIFKSQTNITLQPSTQQTIQIETNNDFTVQNKYDSNKEIFNSLLSLRNLDIPLQSHLKMKVYTLSNSNPIELQWNFDSILPNCSPIAPNLFQGSSQNKDQQDNSNTIQRKSTFISYNYSTSKPRKEIFKDIHIVYLVNKVNLYSLLVLLNFNIKIQFFINFMKLKYLINQQEFRQNRENTPLPILLSLPVCFEISKNQLEIVLEVSKFVSLTEIIQKRKESSGQKYNENELAYIFHSILRCLEVFEQKGLLHSYLVTDNLIYCIESKCYKIQNFSLSQTFNVNDKYNNKKQYQVYYQSPYLSNKNFQMMGDTTIVQQPPFFADRYALAVSFFCIQQLIVPNEANCNIINRAINFLLQNFDESLASTQLIQYLLGIGQYTSDKNSSGPDFWRIAFQILDKIQHQQPNDENLFLNNQQFDDEQSNQQETLLKSESTLKLLAEQYYTTFQFSKSLEYYLELLSVQQSMNVKDEEKILTTLNKIWKIYFSDNDLQNSYLYCSQYTTIAREFYKKQKQQFIIDQQSKIQFQKNIQQSEIKHNTENLSQFNKLQRNLISDFNLSGQLKWQLNKQNEAIEDYEMALSLQIEIYGENEYNVIKNLNNIGVYYSSLQDLNKAIQIISQAVQKMEQQNITDNLYTSALYNLGNLLSDSGQPNEALQYLTKSYEIKRKTLGNNQEVGKIAHLIGTLHFQLKNYQQSLNFLEEAVQITSKFLESDDSEIIKYKRNYIVSLIKNNQNQQANAQIEQIIQTLQNSTLKTFADSPGQVFYELGGFFEKILKYDYALICYDKSATYWQQMEISTSDPSLSACLQRINSLKIKKNQQSQLKDSAIKQNSNIVKEQNNLQQQNIKQKQQNDLKQNIPKQSNQQQNDNQQLQTNQTQISNSSDQNKDQFSNTQQQTINLKQQNTQQQISNQINQQLNQHSQQNESQQQKQSHQIQQPNQQQVNQQNQNNNIQSSNQQQTNKISNQQNNSQVIKDQQVLKQLQDKTNNNTSQQKANINKISNDQLNEKQVNLSQIKQENNISLTNQTPSQIKQESQQQISQQLPINSQQSQFPSQIVLTENLSQTKNNQDVQSTQQIPLKNSQNQLYSQFNQNADQLNENKNNSQINKQEIKNQIQNNAQQQQVQSQNNNSSNVQVQQIQSLIKPEQISQSQQQLQNQINQQTSINGVIPSPNIPSQSQSLGNQMPKLEHLTIIPSEKQN